MKKYFLIITIILILFSCKSKPGTTEDLPEEYLTEVDTDTEIYEELLISEEPQPEEEILLGEGPENITDLSPEIELSLSEPEPEQLPPRRVDEQVVVPPPAPPVTPPQQTQVPPTPAPLPEQVITEQQVPPPPPSPVIPPPVQAQPPVRETPPTPTPMQTIIIPQEPELSSETIYSRVVRATVGQIIEIPFRGTGWVYLGELASRRGVAYDSRRNDPDGQSFIFRAEEAGTYALKFSRHDFIRDYILNDHVQVIIGEAPTAGAGWFSPPVDRGRVVAQPRWPSASEEAEILRGGSRPQAGSSAQQQQPSESAAPSAREPSNISEVLRGSEPPNLPVYEPPSTPQTASTAQPSTTQTPPAQAGETQSTLVQLSPEQLIQRAKESFDAGNAAAAIALLDQYSARFPSGTDELYWLYGQFYEANTPSRNILLSLDYYRRLTGEFPQSIRFNDARRRIAYLERFYINIQ
ncbi:MAG: hypothetical protein LBU88_07265 [Treponema sp.]|jgi:hypothetical protein|nr:hypothetical protein [Treponema sp.]